MLADAALHAETVPGGSPHAYHLADLIRTARSRFERHGGRGAEEALAHPYVAQFHNDEDEPSHPSTITVPIDDNHKYSIEEYREKLYVEIVKRKKELRRKARERDGRDPSRHRSPPRALLSCPVPGPFLAVFCGRSPPHQDSWTARGFQASCSPASQRCLRGAPLPVVPHTIAGFLMPHSGLTTCSTPWLTRPRCAVKLPALQATCVHPP